MSVTMISYAPGGGGNHLKNCLSFGNYFDNSGDLNIDVYNGSAEPPGTVHSIGGRNINQHLVEMYQQHPNGTWLGHGHFGELAQFRNELQDIRPLRFILLTLDNSIDRQLLQSRQSRLGQHHPYWLHEEQLWLYQPAMYNTYFGCHDIFSLSLYDFWNPEFAWSPAFANLKQWLGVDIDLRNVHDIHQRWFSMNFYFDFCSTVRDTYQQKQ